MRSGSSWQSQTKLLNYSGTSAENFGFSVDIYQNKIVVGTPNESVNGLIYSGTASVFHRNNASWDFHSKVTNNSPSIEDKFGESVSIFGNYIAVGSANDDENSHVNNGSTSIFKWNGSAWNFQQKLTHSSSQNGMLFGKSVSLNGDYLLVGAQYYSSPGYNQNGSATIYKRAQTHWMKFQQFSDPSLTSSSFGKSVSIDASTGRFLIGTSNDLSFFGKIKN
jgi:hypothetical protein